MPVPIAVRRWIAAFALTTSLSGCAFLGLDSDSPSSGDDSPTIVGTKEFTDDPLGQDARTYVIAVDGKLVGGGPSGWDDPSETIPGWHSVQFGVARGMTASGSAIAQARLEAGKRYVIRLASSGESTAGWIEEAGGKAVSNHVGVPLETYGDPTPKALPP